MPVFALRCLVVALMMSRLPAVIPKHAAVTVARFDCPYFDPGAARPVLWQHLSGSLPHDVYIIFLPAAGLLS